MDQHGLEYIFDTEVRDGNANWKLCCPFHEEGTPSFMINKDTGQAYCWGCGWAGSVISAIQEHCGFTRDKANRLAVDKLQFRLVEGILKRREARSDAYTVFSEAWLEPWPKKIHKSILERGLSVDILRKSRTRYDPNNGGRQVFPHRDQRGALVGVAGRALAGQDPKWYFYWGYSKGRSLYYGAQQNPAEEAAGTVYVTEGIFDCLWLQQLGLTSSVAILGSKPSKYQIAQLSEYKEVVLALDNDVAGTAGMLKLYKGLRNNVRTRFVQWSAKDPLETQQNALQEAREPWSYYEWRKSSRTKSMISELESLRKQSSSQNSSAKRTKATAMQP